MILNIVIILGSAASAGYLYYLLLFRKGIRNGQRDYSNQKRTVSVVVAARNEEYNIGRLLTSLVNQSYPSELFEIILVDDSSSDNTKNIIDTFADKWKNIKLLCSKNREKAVSAKKNALAQAIAASSNDIILTTDADCIVGHYWIASMVANFNEETDMVVGFSRTYLPVWKKAGFISKFEHFDFLLMFMAAAGSISVKKYFSCSGQNLSYKKKSFEQVNGFEKIEHIVSGDDVNLMQLMRKNKMKIKFAFAHHSFVYTQAHSNWKNFINQRCRWASNARWQLNLNPEFFWYLFCVFVIVFFPYFLFFHIWQLSLLILILRLVGELSFLKTAFAKFQIDKNKLKFFPIWFIFQPIYILIVALFGQLNLFKWKQ